MKVSYEWLNEFVDVKDIAPEAIAERMSRTGIEVEGVEQLGAVLDKVIIGHAVTVKPHENSDHLSVCQVDIGEAELSQIVCGAPNIASGQKVIVALHNSRIAGNIKIKKSKMRGEVSNGMICSFKEIGFAENVIPKKYANGIAVLPEDAPVGTPIAEYFNMLDYIIELDITPNRADALSMRGAAWEIGAIYDRQPHMPTIDSAKYEANDLGDKLSLEVTDTSLVPAYHAYLVENVKIQESPLWLQIRLMAAGIRPLNNVVDITNYVLLEYGQPLHAFDYDKLASKKIVTRLAKAGEVLTTLDEMERTLSVDDIVITDGEKPVALAGVMGGFDTQIDDHTTTVLIEAAMFEPIHIRTTARKFGLRSESSLRNERGINKATIASAGAYAAQLMEELAGGTAVAGRASVDTVDAAPVEVASNLAAINKSLGTALAYVELEKVFAQLGFAITGTAEAFTVAVPVRRWDISIPADLVEEAGRIYGYDKIPATLPASKPGKIGFTKRQLFTRQTRKIMAALGFDQTIAYSLTSAEKRNILQPVLLKAVELDFPMSDDRRYMRTNLLSSLLDIAQYNVARSNDDVAIYESGRIFYWTENTELPDEANHLAALWTGNKQGNTWQENEQPVNFYDMKGVLEQLLAGYNLATEVDFVAEKNITGTHPGRTAQIVTTDKKGETISLGYVAELHPNLVDQYDLKATFVFELTLDKVFSLATQVITQRPIPKFPATSRDIAILVDDTLTNAEIIRIIKAAGNAYLADVHIFDYYKGETIEDGKKSVAYSLTYINPEATLTDEDVNANFDNIVAALQEKAGAVIR